MSQFSILLLIFFVSCNTGRVRTPNDFVNEVPVEGSLYNEDSKTIRKQLFDSMVNHRGFFNHPEYYDSTQLFVDTILYDPTFQKVALFVIARNPTYRNPYSDSKLPYYFNGACYIGKRLATGLAKFDLMQLGPFSLGNFHHLPTIRKALRDYYFLQLNTVLDEKGESVFQYNLDDKRFWGSVTGWKRIEKKGKERI